MGLLRHRRRSDPHPVSICRPPDTELRCRLRDLANARRRFGYRRLFVLLRQQGEPSGINRIYRLYREEGLTVRRRRARRHAVGLDHARQVIGSWAYDYNTARPHSSLAYQTTAADAADLTATGARLRNPDQLRRSPVAHTAPQGVSTAKALTAAG